jgi:hypothetical protein
VLIANENRARRAIFKREFQVGLPSQLQSVRLG